MAGPKSQFNKDHLACDWQAMSFTGKEVQSDTGFSYNQVLCVIARASNTVPTFELLCAVLPFFLNS